MEIFFVKTLEFEANKIFRYRFRLPSWENITANTISSEICILKEKICPTTS